MSTPRCDTCRHFTPCAAPRQWYGSCDVVNFLPAWFARRLDVDVGAHSDRGVRGDDVCGLHDPKPRVDIATESSPGVQP